MDTKRPKGGKIIAIKTAKCISKNGAYLDHNQNSKAKSQKLVHNGMASQSCYGVLKNCNFCSRTPLMRVYVTDLLLHKGQETQKFPMLERDIITSD